MIMKNEFDMEIIDVVDVGIGLATIRIKKKFALSNSFKNKFYSSREWKEKRKKFLNNYDRRKYQS